MGEKLDNNIFSQRQCHQIEAFLEDIDWCSSNNSTVCAVRSISAPILVVAAQGHYFIRDGEQIFRRRQAWTKTFSWSKA